MTEIDAFERRVAETFRWYADDVTPVVDAADVAHRVALEHPRRRKGAIAWRPVAMPRLGVPLRLAWVLLLLAGLLTVMIGGMLIVGSQPEQRLSAVVPVFTCPPGTNPDEPGPVDQVRPADLSGLAGLGTMAFDRQAGKLVALAGALTGPVETWTFDVCTNTWMQMHPDREPPASVGGLVYDADSDVTIGVHFGDWHVEPDPDIATVWAYDLEANTWTEKGVVPIGTGLEFHDPASGLVVALGDDDDDDTLGLELSSYDIETDTWTPIRQAERLNVGPHYEFFAYDASVDRLVAYANAWKPSGNGDWLFEPKTWLFDLRSGTWSGTDAVTPEFSAGMWGDSPAIVYDEAADRTVMLGQGHSAAYDATADRWETLWVGPSEEGACGTRPECRQGPGVIYDAVNERLVVYGGSAHISAEGLVDPDDLLAFDVRTREWTVLLAPSDGQPAPSPE